MERGTWCELRVTRLRALRVGICAFGRRVVSACVAYDLGLRTFFAPSGSYGRLCDVYWNLSCNHIRLPVGVLLGACVLRA